MSCTTIWWKAWYPLPSPQTVECEVFGGRGHFESYDGGSSFSSFSCIFKIFWIFSLRVELFDVAEMWLGCFAWLGHISEYVYLEEQWLNNTWSLTHFCQSLYFVSHFFYCLFLSTPVKFCFTGGLALNNSYMHESFYILALLSLPSCVTLIFFKSCV